MSATNRWRAWAAWTHGGFVGNAVSRWATRFWHRLATACSWPAGAKKKKSYPTVIRIKTAVTLTYAPVREIGSPVGGYAHVWREIPAGVVERRRPVVRHHDDYGVVQHFFRFEGCHHASHRFVQFRYHGCDDHTNIINGGGGVILFAFLQSFLTGPRRKTAFPPCGATEEGATKKITTLFRIRTVDETRT